MECFPNLGNTPRFRLDVGRGDAAGAAAQLAPRKRQPRQMLRQRPDARTAQVAVEELPRSRSHTMEVVGACICSFLFGSDFFAVI